MPEPIISVPWSDQTQTLLDWNKVKVNGELATDLLSQRDRYRAALREMSDELSHYPEGDGIFGHLKRILRRALA